MRLPLRYDDGASEILDADGEAVCDMFNSSFDSPANAAHAAEIVAACNAHEALVKLLERWTTGYTGWAFADIDWNRLHGDTVAALESIPKT